MGCCESRNENQTEDYFSEKLPLEEINEEMNNIPHDKCLCPNCSETAELLKVYVDNNKIELFCKTHNLVELTIEEFIKKTKEKFNDLKGKCEDSECNNEPYIYCYDCEKNLCKSHLGKNHSENNSKHKINNHSFILYSQKNIKCPNHNNDITLFCVDCQENICENDEEHKHHEKKKLSKLLKDVREKKSIIKEKNKMLNCIVNYNQKIINSGDKTNINNLYNSLKEENERNSNEIEIFNYISKRHSSAIEEFKAKFKIDLKKENTEELKLNNKKLENKGFNLITKIFFNNLRKLNVSNNGIKYVSCLKRMHLPDLEELDMSENEIENISSVAELKSKKIKIINLNNNAIKDISPFLKSDFPALEKLMLIGHKNNDDDNVTKKNNFNELKRKYKDKLIDE